MWPLWELECECRCAGIRLSEEVKFSWQAQRIVGLRRLVGGECRCVIGGVSGCGFGGLELQNCLTGLLDVFSLMRFPALLLEDKFPVCLLDAASYDRGLLNQGWSYML